MSVRQPPEPTELQRIGMKAMDEDFGKMLPKVEVVWETFENDVNNVVSIWWDSQDLDIYCKTFGGSPIQNFVPALHPGNRTKANQMLPSMLHRICVKRKGQDGVHKTICLEVESSEIPNDHILYTVSYILNHGEMWTPYKEPIFAPTTESPYEERHRKREIDRHFEAEYIYGGIPQKEVPDMLESKGYGHLVRNHSDSDSGDEHVKGEKWSSHHKPKQTTNQLEALSASEPRINRVKDFIPGALASTFFIFSLASVKIHGFRKPMCRWQKPLLHT